MVSVFDSTRDVGINLKLNIQQSHLTYSLKRPRWSLAFDPVNQIVFWSDAHTGLIGAENARSGRTIGLVANLTEVCNI